ncbi:MAG TPA: adenylosuccinate synthase [Cyclobacteriaceae bacterium]
MPVDVILGLQWGDEGKGKIVDFLAPDYDIVARFQGGPNAGHTLEFGDTKHVLHQIPSGIFHDGVINIIGNGVVLDPIIFKGEIQKLEDLNVDVRRKLIISNKAQLILPTHRLLDHTSENAKGKDKIGSTLKGIGPTYQDKIARRGIRIGDILDDGSLKKKYYDLVKYHEGIFDYYKVDYEAIDHDSFFSAVDFLRTFNIQSTEYLVNDELSKGKSILAEGAQGSLLDIEFGSYPYVTSSNTLSSGVSSGLGVPPNKLSNIYGVFKAYCTRVGSGPFPTELFDDDGHVLRSVGNEFGSTTGRPRRCGWLDLVALKYTIMLNGVTELFIMKSDVMDNLSTIKLANKYFNDNTELEALPYELINTTPKYESLPGWMADLSKITSPHEIPDNFLKYLKYIENYSSLDISIISTGPKRNQIIVRKR